jgi:hypothetical protein
VDTLSVLRGTRVDTELHHHVRNTMPSVPWKNGMVGVGFLCLGSHRPPLTFQRVQVQPCRRDAHRVQP